jgi:hypothetical protein
METRYMSDDEWMNIITCLPVKNYLNIMLCNSTFNDLIQSRWKQVLNTQFSHLNLSATLVTQQEAKQVIRQIHDLSFDTVDCLTDFLSFREHDTIVQCTSKGDIPVRFKFPILRADVVFCMEFTELKMSDIGTGLGVASKPCLDRLGTLNNLLFHSPTEQQVAIEHIVPTYLYLCYYYVSTDKIDFTEHDHGNDYYETPDSDVPIQMLNIGYFTNGFM